MEELIGLYNEIILTKTTKKIFLKELSILLQKEISFFHTVNTKTNYKEEKIIETLSEKTKIITSINKTIIETFIHIDDNEELSAKYYNDVKQILNNIKNDNTN